MAIWVAMGPNIWGRGETRAEAIKVCNRHGRGLGQKATRVARLPKGTIASSVECDPFGGLRWEYDYATPLEDVEAANARGLDWEKLK